MERCGVRSWAIKNQVAGCPSDLATFPDYSGAVRLWPSSLTCLGLPPKSETVEHLRSIAPTFQLVKSGLRRVAACRTRCIRPNCQIRLNGLLLRQICNLPRWANLFFCNRTPCHRAVHGASVATETQASCTPKSRLSGAAKVGLRSSSSAAVGVTSRTTRHVGPTFTA